MKTCLSVLLVPALITIAAAQDSPDSWVREALDRNPEIAAARQRWDAAQSRASQAGALMDPMAGAMLMREGTTGFSDYDMVEWMVSQQLSGFGKRGARKAAAAREAEAAGYEYLETLRAVRARVTTSRWNLWAARRSIEIMREALQLATQVEQAALACCEAGTGGQSDVLRAQIERAKLQDELATLEQRARVAETAVNALLNSAPDTPRDPGDPPRPAPEIPEPADLLAQARTNNAMLVARARMADARRAAAQAARREYTPDVELFVKARQPRGGGIQEYDTGVQFSVPWLWRGKYRGMIREARAELDAAESDYTNAFSRLSVELLDMHATTDAARRRVELYESVVLEKTRQLVDTTLVEYESGRSDFFALLDASRERLNAETEHVIALAEYARSVALLNQMSGPFEQPEQDSGALTEGD